MTALLIVLAAIVLLFIGYVFYGSWLAKQWGIDPTKKTPAIEKEDGVDYVAAKPAVLMGHHFSSIAGAGPINGPIQASIFGWVPVFLWCIIGGIFFGGLQDFGSLFASIRHDGKSVGEIIEDSMGSRAKKLFIIFALLVLILVIASFVNIVAGTFLTVADEAGKTAFGFVTNPTGNQSTAMISLLFIVLAVIYGYVTNRMGVKTLPATIGGIMAADSIYANNANRKFCTKYGISTSFVRKGRAARDESLRKVLRSELSKERATRLEGSFGTQKQHYSLSRIKARNRKTEILWIFFGIHTANAVLMIDKIRNRTVKAV